MAGIEDNESQELQKNDCSFEWDEQSQLFFHASSGFYHDPNAGWYYSSRDGLYYKFENGSYVLLDSKKGEESEAYDCKGVVSGEHSQDEPCTEIDKSDGPDTTLPPSEWLEETLIDLYLSGYSNSAINPASDVVTPLEKDGNDSNSEVEEGEWIPDPEDLQDATELGGTLSDDVVSWDEENWKAQYGQVIQSEEASPNFPVVDLWDWRMVIEMVKKKKKKKKKHQVAKLVGRLVRQSTKLHPSLPSGGGLLKTASICGVHLDLVRVASGQVYRLRSPSQRYLASLLTYDSSNPTKDWRFPDLLVDKLNPLPLINGTYESETPDGAVCEDSSALPDQFSVVDKHNSLTYRDRAAERRTLHGGFGIGPGQKNLGISEVDSGGSSSVSITTEEAAAEALNTSFGTNSYARRILESMGWRQGESLGSSTKGLIEPLQAVGNKGYAGLGWDQGRPNHH